jgi:hypothetical protein
VSIFVLIVSPEIEDRNEVEVATGLSTKRPSTLNDIITLRVFYHSIIFFCFTVTVK